MIKGKGKGRSRSGSRAGELLVAEPVGAFAVGAVPGDAVTGHAPDVFVHAGLAYGKAAAACPGERGDLAATVAFTVCGPAGVSAVVSRFFVMGNGH